MTEEQRDAFLKDLTKLTKKHKIEIWGCGCCGSPGISSLKRVRNNATYETKNRCNDDTFENLRLVDND